MEEPDEKPLIPFTPASPEEHPGDVRRGSSSLPKHLDFEPVRLRYRRDGWTVDKQIAFIVALAETGIVEHACRRVGMSRTSADELRRRPCGMEFRRAWDIAIEYSFYRIEEEAALRSRHGVARPIFYKGEQVGEYRHFDERLTMFLLRTRRPQRYGKWVDGIPAPEQDPDACEDPAIALDGGLSRIEWRAQDVLLDSDDDDDDDLATAL